MAKAKVKNSKKDQEWYAKVAEERRVIAEIVGERLRAMRADTDIGQEQMGYLLGGQSAATVRRMEAAQTSASVVDWILWARRTNRKPAEVFEDLMYFVDRYGRKRDA